MYIVFLSWYGNKWTELNWTMATNKEIEVNTKGNISGFKENFKIARRVDIEPHVVEISWRNHNLTSPTSCNPWCFLQSVWQNIVSHDWNASIKMVDLLYNQLEHATRRKHPLLTSLQISVTVWFYGHGSAKFHGLRGMVVGVCSSTKETGYNSSLYLHVNFCIHHMDGAHEV